MVKSLLKARLITILLIFVLLAGCSPSYKTLDVQAAKSLFEEGNHILIDVRTIEEYEEQHVPGSINIPVNDLETELVSLDKKGKYIIICRVGARSERAAQILADKGFKDVTNISGGGVFEWLGVQN